MPPPRTADLRKPAAQRSLPHPTADRRPPISRFLIVRNLPGGLLLLGYNITTLVVFRNPTATFWSYYFVIPKKKDVFCQCYFKFKTEKVYVILFENFFSRFKTKNILQSSKIICSQHKQVIKNHPSIVFAWK